MLTRLLFDRARHVKCDEAKPSCHRCQSAGRVCGGYANSEPDRRPNYAFLMPKPGQMVKQVALSPPTGIDAWCSMNLEFFHTYTVRDLPGSDLGLPWSTILMATGVDPTINRAVSALGCLHRSLTGAASTPSTTGSDGLTAPFEQYHKAIVAVRRYINRAHEVGLDVARETTLTATLLLFCFEILSGHDELAMRHLEAGFRILAKTHKNRLTDASKGYTALTLTSDQYTTRDALTQVYLRLASDWLVSGMFHHDNANWPLQAVCIDSMPIHFQSKRDASVHLDALCSDVARLDDEVTRNALKRNDFQGAVNEGHVHECANLCWAFATARGGFEDLEPLLHQSLGKTMIDLQRWRTAFSSLVEANPQSKPIMLLEVQFLQAWFMLRLIRDYDQALCDDLLREFEHVIKIAERYVYQQDAEACRREDIDRSLPHLSQLGNNLASGVCFVIEKCRDSNIRRRAIQVLSSIDLRGTFDMPYLIAYYKHLVDVEEIRARVENSAATGALTCEDFPIKARFKETMFCDCEEVNEGDLFYKFDHGRMLYAAENDFGILEVAESWFDVQRERLS